MQVPECLYKILSKEDWDASQRGTQVVRGAIDTTFIHLAALEQVEGVIRKFWSQVTHVIILKIDPKLLKGELVFEKNPGGSQAYWHLYEGSISLHAVLKATLWQVGESFF